MINVENLNFSYGKSPVINNLNWQLETGGIHGLVGMNGAGKTTLFNLIAGWLKPAGGHITFEGSAITRQHSALMETNPLFYPMITGQEYIDVFKLRNPLFDEQVWNSYFGLPLNEVVDNYSTGMKKRLEFMGILALDRDILILDEPFNGLDFEAVRLIQQILPSLTKKGKTIIMSSHIAESLTTISDTISFIKNGAIEFSLLKPDFESLMDRINSGSGTRPFELP